MSGKNGSNKNGKDSLFFNLGQCVHCKEKDKLLVDFPFDSHHGLCKSCVKKARSITDVKQENPRTVTKHKNVSLKETERQFSYVKKRSVGGKGKPVPCSVCKISFASPAIGNGLCFYCEGKQSEIAS